MFGWSIRMAIQFCGNCYILQTGAGTLGKAACLANEIVIGGHECFSPLPTQHPPIDVCCLRTTTLPELFLTSTLLLLFLMASRESVGIQLPKVRAREPTEVDVSEQQLAYCDTYYVIDKEWYRG